MNEATAALSLAPTGGASVVARSALDATLLAADELVQTWAGQLGVDPRSRGAGTLWVEGPLRFAALLARLADGLALAPHKRPRVREMAHGVREMPLRFSRGLRAIAPGVTASLVSAQSSESRAPDAPIFAPSAGGWPDALAFALVHGLLEGRPSTVALDPSDGALEAPLARIVAPLQGQLSVIVDHLHDARSATHLPSAAPVASPFIVAPYLFDRASLDHLARLVVSEVVRSVGRPSFDMPVLLLPRAWPQHAGLVDRIRERLARVPPRAARGEPLTWVVLDDLGPDDVTSLARDPVAGTLLVASVGPTDDVGAHLGEAVTFSNERLLGARAATLMVHPYPAEEPAVARAIVRAQRDLAAPVVGLGTPGSMARLLGLPWGAELPSWGRVFGAPVAKVLLRGPFGGLVRPATFVDHRGMPHLAPRLLAGLVRGGVRAHMRAFFSHVAA